jgi:hypothetical protein
MKKPFVPRPLIDLLSLLVGPTDNPSGGKVEDPHQADAPSPPILGHASFRPYAEPLLQPKNGSGGPIYDLFQKSFSPMDKKIVFPNQNGEEEEQRVITPSKSSTTNLFEPPPSDLTELLPDGAQKEDYLPAIRLAIRLTTWKQTLQEKCRNAWTRWKHRHQKVEISINPFLEAYPEMRRIADSEDYLFKSSQGADSFEDVGGDLLDGFETPFDINNWNEKSAKLESAYNALKGVLYDYQYYGLLHYRPLADTSRAWARQGTSEVFQAIKKVIASWTAVYDMFTHPRVYTEAPGWLEHGWKGDTLRRYADIHRQIQFLPSCLLFGTPAFPNSNEFSTKKAYFDEIVKTVNQTADYLNESLEAALRTAQNGGSQSDSQTLESFRARITHILNKGVFKHPPATSPGPLFLIDDLRKMPTNLVNSLPHYSSDDALIDAAIDAYQNNLLKMETIFSQVLNFPGSKPQ